MLDLGLNNSFASKTDTLLANLSSSCVFMGAFCLLNKTRIISDTIHIDKGITNRLKKGIKRVKRLIKKHIMYLLISMRGV